MTSVTVALVGCIAFSRHMFDVVAAMPESRIATVVTRDLSPGKGIVSATESSGCW